MSFISSYRMLNALENGSLSGAQLQTLLGNQRYVDEFYSLIETEVTAKRIGSSTNAMNAIANSAIAKAALDSKVNALVYVMSGGAAGRTYVWGVDAALTTLRDSGPWAFTELRKLPNHILFVSANVTGSTRPYSSAIPNAAGKYIVMGVSQSFANSQTLTVNTRRTGSTIANTVLTSSVSLVKSSLSALASVFVPTQPSSTYSIVASDGTSHAVAVSILRCDA
jgi:hypothetical protein